MRKTWQVEVLIFEDNDYDDRDTILVLIDDKEWLRAHYDFRTCKWVESRTAGYEGLQRNEQRTPRELLDWLLGSRASALTNQ